MSGDGSVAQDLDDGSSLQAADASGLEPDDASPPAVVDDHDARERRRLELADPERAEVTRLEQHDPNHPAVAAWRKRRIAAKRRAERERQTPEEGS